MKRNLTCIVCPRGCALEVEINDGKCTVKGNACPKGETYGIDECTAPTRMVTSIVRVSNREDSMVSVKTSCPIPKDKIFDIMSKVRNTEIMAPVKIGDIIIKDLYGADIIATKEIL